MSRFLEYEFLQKISKFLKCLKFFDSPVEKTVEKTVENFSNNKEKNLNIYNSSWITL